MRLRNRLELVRSYVAGDEPRGAVPTSAYIESTSRCNLSCPMCARQFAGPDWRSRDMTISELETALRALGDGTELVLPFAGGEPLLHPQIARFVELCVKSGRRAELATNATVLTGRVSRDLITAGLSTLVISLDAAHPDSYARIRRGGDYERTRSNIMSFLRHKRALRGKTWVIVQMIDLPENRGEFREFLRQWKDVPGVDAVRLKADEVNVTEVRRGSQGRHRSQYVCYAPWLGPLMIRHDGSVYPCCHAWQDEPVGHMDEDSIDQIWRGEAMRALRRAHVEGKSRRYPGCRDCQTIIPHPLLIAGSLLAPAHFTRRAIPIVEELNRRSGGVLIRNVSQ